MIIDEAHTLLYLLKKESIESIESIDSVLEKLKSK